MQSKPVSRKPEEMIHEVRKKYLPLFLRYTVIASIIYMGFVCFLRIQIELEWCGSAKGYTTEICIGKLLYKVTDMLLLIKKHTHS